MSGIRRLASIASGYFQPAEQTIYNKGRELLQKSPLVQAIQQKSLSPYKQPLSDALQPMNLLPMGGMTRAAAYAKYMNPKVTQKGIQAAKADMSAYRNSNLQNRAMQHLDSAEATAGRIKAYAQQKAQEEFNRVHQYAPSVEKMLSTYRNYFR
jgi:hypothetical protein